MLTFFRNFFKTKIGLAIVLAFLGLIAFAFASMDVSNTGAFGGVAGGDSVAVVGDHKIGTAEFNQAMDDELRRARQENPEATMQTLIAEGAIDRVLDNLIDRYALLAWSEENGYRAGDNLLNSEIRTIPAARGPSGNFDEAAYAAFLRNNNLTDSMLRQQLRTSLYFRQAVFPGIYGAQLPDSIARTYARSFKERRSGSIATISAALFAPQGDPTTEQLNAFYTENRARFVRPERRTLRYTTFDSAALGDSINPTDEEIAAYYRDNAEEYAARETRSFTQLIVPTREGAEALAARVRGGESFAQAASSSGLRTTQLEGRERAQIRSSASAAVADAYFSAAEGAVTTPARSSLGWHIARVTSVNEQPQQSLADARASIVETLSEEKRQRGIAELAVSIEDRLSDGASLTSIASELSLELTTTPPITASGQFYGTPGRIPQLLAPALEFAFQIDEGEPEIGALADQETFILYEVADIEPSAAAPLAEIRDEAIAEWRRVRGDEGAEAAADRILKRVEGGASLAEAVAAEEKAISAPQQVNFSREELARMGNNSVPAPVALMFGMAQGTAKKLEGSRDQGWYVVDLDTITLEELEENDPLIGQAKNQVAQAWSNEYGTQLIAAMRASLGVERNEEAIAAVRRRLLGEAN
ncbi:SurA N-terminal domain-containing protein [Qipengyuania aurantiaca]|uniref:Parvulin-like PPIase n=1 Tax=Qipengyuania aurantiaca TaxID=2867233 RepID=A0ABX8ZKU5_9SPHN|nr:peptidylprolyl isomerase [Qipengyuania aurantiaca]QZD89622.1 SurA N-terminal domain-containing protein [Qipengyuania aurantiaca]